MIRNIYIPFLFFLLLAVVVAGCFHEEGTYYDGMGKRPVYIPESELYDVKSELPRPITTSGSIFLKDTLLFVLEQRRGIHVYSLQDSLNSVNLAFLKIPSITDFTVYGNYIYADSWKDLVVIDITDLNQIRETSRIRDALNPPLYPPLYDGIFECVDESKGAVIDWEDAELVDAKCVTVN